MKKMRLRVRKVLWLHAQLWTPTGLCPMETELSSMPHGAPGALEKADGPKEGPECLCATVCYRENEIRMTAPFSPANSIKRSAKGLQAEWPPKDVPILIPATYEYVRSHGKGALRLQVELWLQIRGSGGGETGLTR